MYQDLLHYGAALLPNGRDRDHRPRGSVAVEGGPVCASAPRPRDAQPHRELNLTLGAAQPHGIGKSWYCTHGRTASICGDEDEGDDRLPPRIFSRWVAADLDQQAHDSFSSSSSAPSGSTPPPINDKNLSQNKNAPGELHSAKPAYVRFAPKVSYLTLFGSAAFIYFWVNPRLEELVNELNALRRERSILIKAVEDCQRENIQAKGHGKESDGQKTS